MTSDPRLREALEEIEPHVGDYLRAMLDFVRADNALTKALFSPAAQRTTQRLRRFINWAEKAYGVQLPDATVIGYGIKEFVHDEPLRTTLHRIIEQQKPLTLEGVLSFAREHTIEYSTEPRKEWVEGVDGLDSL